MTHLAVLFTVKEAQMAGYSPDDATLEMAALLGDDPDGDQPEAFEAIYEQWLDDVFGYNSRLEDDQFVENASKAGAWLFDQSALRSKFVDKYNDQ